MDSTGSAAGTDSLFELRTPKLVKFTHGVSVFIETVELLECFSVAGLKRGGVTGSHLEADKARARKGGNAEENGKDD